MAATLDGDEHTPTLLSIAPDRTEATLGCSTTRNKTPLGVPNSHTRFLAEIIRRHVKSRINFSTKY